MATIRIETLDEETCEIQIDLPGKYEVCPRCEGTGKHTNPAIDGNGISREDFDADPDFEEAYFSGRYDVQCEKCKGERVVLMGDEAKMTPEEKKIWHKHRREQADERCERRYQERFGF